MAQLDRITQDLQVMGGKPCVRGMRVTVGMIVGQIGAGHSIEEVLGDYPYLEREDVASGPALRRLARRGPGSHVASCMKFLVDMNLSPKWVTLFRDSGWEAIHWSDVGQSTTRDSEIMA